MGGNVCAFKLAKNNNQVANVRSAEATVDTPKDPGVLSKNLTAKNTFALDTDLLLTTCVTWARARR